MDWFFNFVASSELPGQSFFAVCIMMCEATLIADPALIDFFILSRHHTLDNKVAIRSGFTTCVQCNIASDRALRTDRSGRLQLPGTRLETEIPGRQRADRANVDRKSTRL